MVLSAKTTIDLFGDEGSQAERVLKQYSGPIMALEESLHELLVTDQLQAHPEKLNEVGERKRVLVNKIKKDYGYAYVDVSTVNYSSDSVYITIEVIRKEQPHRLKFIDDHRPVTHRATKDLIHDMERYNELGTTLFLNDQLNPEKLDCPFYHCTWGFEHPKLKPFHAQFQQGVSAQKSLILETLHADPDPERRAAAVFLVGHFDNPQEIIDLLVPHVLDNDSGIRNNAMRVIGTTLTKYKTAHVNIDPFLHLLSSPYDTDRNKSLLVLLQVCDANRQKMIQEGKESLLALLALKQPNNHEPAYQILKKISGKNYSDTDLKSWKAWADSVQATN
ncbi:HEAT repeat domain-containing protein [Legionella rubrilucens]|nr:HEAT repeat domain-containing protein [Legionella rubrilucens]